MLVRWKMRPAHFRSIGNLNEKTLAARECLEEKRVDTERCLKRHVGRVTAIKTNPEGLWQEVSRGRGVCCWKKKSLWGTRRQGWGFAAEVHGAPTVSYLSSTLQWYRGGSDLNRPRTVPEIMCPR